MHTNQILLSSNRLEPSPWSFAYVFKKIETATSWNCMLKGLRLLQITAILQDCPFFTVFITIKTSSQNIAMTLLQILLKLHRRRSGYWRKKLPWTILEEQFQALRNTAASKIGSDTISLPWYLRCHCNPDHNKFSSLSSTTVVAILISKSLFMATLFMLKLGRYWPWKTASSHLNKTSPTKELGIKNCEIAWWQKR